MTLRRWPSLAGGVLGALVLLAHPAQAAGPSSTIESVRPTATGLEVALRATGLPSGTDLDPSSISVRLDGEPVPARSSGERSAEGDAPVRSVALVVDVSGSMAGNRLAAAKTAGQSYLAAVPEDVQVSLITFAQQPTVVAAPSTDRSAVSSALAAMVPAGGTSLYDAVIKGADTVAGADEKRVVLLSDGEDTESSAALGAALHAVAASGVGLDAVVLGDEPAAVDALTRLAAAGDGRLLAAESGSDASRAFVDAARAFDAKLVLRIDLPADPEGGSALLRTDVRTTTGETLSAQRVVLLPSRGTSERGGPRTRDAVFGALAVFVGLAALLLMLLQRGDTHAGDKRRTRAVLDTYSTRTIPTAVEADDASPLGRGALVAGAVTLMGLFAARGARGARLAARLDRAAVRLTAAEWMVVHLTITSLTLLVLFLLAPPAIAIAGGVVAMAGPSLWLRRKGSSRQSAFVENMPDSLQLISSGLASGYSLPQALDSVVREGQDPVAAEFGRALAETRLGVPVENALDGVAARMDSDDFRWVVMAIRVQREVGGNLAEVLQTVCQTMRERASLRRQVAALSAEGRLSAVILVLLPILLAVYMALSSPEFFAPMYQTSVGISLLLASAVSLTIGAFWMSKLVKVEM